MADIGAVDLLCYGVMGQFGDIGMTVPAGNTMMDGFAVDMFIDIIIYSFTVFINPAHKSIFVAHKTVFLVRCLCRKTDKQENKHDCNKQENF
jgi:hypothetical protein